ncbi:MAG: thioredoxin family protein [Pseudomonadota bacterium]
MNRRSFLWTLSVLPFLSLPAFAMGPRWVNYKPGLVEEALDDGLTVLLDFAADWCSTCKRQERVIGQLRGENPNYDAILFVRVNWDIYRTADITRDLKVPRRSTLVLLKGQDELGRLVAQTSTDRIKGLLDIGLEAATTES